MKKARDLAMFLFGLAFALVFVVTDIPAIAAGVFTQTIANIKINGVMKALPAINYENHNYVQLADLAPEIGYVGWWSAEEGMNFDKVASPPSAIEVPYTPPVINPAAPIEHKSFEGNLPDDRAVNTYNFVLPYDARVNLDFTHDYTEYDNRTFWNIKLIAEDTGNIIFDFESKDSGASTVPAYLPAGDYLVRVTHGRYDHRNTNYTATINYERNVGNFEAEPNNTNGTATQIQVDKPMTGHNLFDGDIDYYTFTIGYAANANISFTHDIIDGSKNWKIELIKDDTILTFNSKGGILNTVSDTVTLTSGKYFVRVTRGDAGAEDYTLTVNRK
ncbi:MAG: hypothetical protein LBM98_10940 [Oscillospiraceae bacterium]|jgi:hypothetical protein|nr:hypothetical protein [Oscillospiraceae bacterium]